LGQADARGRWWAWGAAPLGITLLGQARQFALAQQFALGQTNAAVVTLDALTTAALIALIVALGWRLTRRQPNPQTQSLAPI
ncbi:MAG TPA: hypothetical protein VF725_05615, partial [Ktedonobacterales bacterium]